MAGPLRGLLLRDSDDDGGMAGPGESQRPQREDIMLLICRMRGLATWRPSVLPCLWRRMRQVEGRSLWADADFN